MAEVRVLIGQKAAVHGLMLAGVSFRTSCDIVSCGTSRMRPYVKADWLRQPLPVPVREMSPEQWKLYRKMRGASQPQGIAFEQAMRGDASRVTT